MNTGIQGKLLFMSIELLMANTVEHSAQHNLESLFYVLLYICTMCKGPGKKWSGGDRDKPSHPFAYRMRERYDIGAFRIAAFSSSRDTRVEVFKHVYPYFDPLISLLEKFCDTNFLVYENTGQMYRYTSRPFGTHTNVLRILREAFDALPDKDSISGRLEERPAAMGPPTNIRSGRIPVCQRVVGPRVSCSGEKRYVSADDIGGMCVLAAAC
jgi:hypothetical protein